MPRVSSWSPDVRAQKPAVTCLLLVGHSIGKLSNLNLIRPLFTRIYPLIIHDDVTHYTLCDFAFIQLRLESSKCYMETLQTCPTLNGECIIIYPVSGIVCVCILKRRRMTSPTERVVCHSRGVGAANSQKDQKPCLASSSASWSWLLTERTW